MTEPELGSGALREASERLCEQIDSYLTLGGLFNAELANHDAVRDLLIGCRVALSLSSPIEPCGHETRFRMDSGACAICELNAEATACDEAEAKLAQASSEIRERECNCGWTAWCKRPLSWVGLQGHKPTCSYAPSRQGAGGK